MCQRSSKGERNERRGRRRKGGGGVGTREEETFRINMRRESARWTSLQVYSTK